MPHECTNCSRTFPDGSKEMLSGCPDCGGNKFRYRPAGGKLDSDARDAGSGSSNDDGIATDATPDRATSTDPPGGSGVTDTVSRATRNLREWVGVDDEDGRPGTARDDPGGGSNGRVAREETSPADDGQESSALEGRSPDPALEGQFEPSPADDAVVESGGTDDDAEDAAQASARTSMVGADELPDDAPAADPATDPGVGGAAGSSDPGVDRTPDEGSDLSELRQELNDQFESIKIVEPGQYELNLMELYDREEYIISLMEDGRYAIEVPETWRDSGD